MDENQRKPDIGLMIMENLLPDLEGEIRSDLQHPELEIATERHTGGPYAGLEIYLPTAVIIFIASSYFHGFLNKAGQDHYERIKSVATKLWLRLYPLGIHLTKKTPTDDSPEYSFGYSIIGEISPKIRFKLIIREDQESEKSIEGISVFLDFLRSIHDKEFDQEAMLILLKQRSFGGTFIVTFDHETGELKPVDKQSD